MSEFCEKVDREGLLIQLLDKELLTVQEDEVLDHLRTCSDCLAKVARLMITNDQLNGDLQFTDDTHDSSLNDHAEPAIIGVAPPPAVPGEGRMAPADGRKELVNQGKIKVNELPIGEALDFNLYDGEGHLLIASNTPLTEGVIESIRRRGVTEVTVKRSRQVVGTAYAREAIAFKGQPDRGFYIALSNGAAPAAVSVLAKQMAVDSLKRAFANVSPNTAIDVDDVRDTCEDVVNDLIGDDIVSPSIIDIYLTDSSLYHHSMNVMMMFTALCGVLGLPRSGVKAYAAGAMLHDLGRVLLRKIAGVSSSKQINVEKLHSEAGYKYLKGLGEFEPEVTNAVRNHHERLDGLGYPRHVHNSELDEYTQALIIANFYDNNTWDRSRELKIGFHRSANLIIQQSGKLVAAKVVEAFLNAFGHHPPGSWVKLASGEAGIVVQATPFKRRRPTVHLYYDHMGERLSESMPLDLSEPNMPGIVGRFDPQ
jgi:putative nucleotidyltransferase with HDIG domain